MVYATLKTGKVEIPMRSIFDNIALRKILLSNGLQTSFHETSYASVSTYNASFYGWMSQKRWMTKSKRVQDRSKIKHVHDLELITQKWKVASKVLFIIDLLKKEHEQIIQLRKLEQYRQQLNIHEPHNVVDFIKKAPKIFGLYKDTKGVLWCGLTEKAEELVQEENKLLEDHTEKAVEFVSRLLMMSVDKRLSLDKISQFRRDMGLPIDFRTRWVHRFPENFKFIELEGVECLQLMSWNPSWAVTEIEKKANGVLTNYESHTPGLITHPFPMKFPPNAKKLFRFGGKIEHFQKLPYLSPYADARELSPGNTQFNKRAVAVMHEILSFTIEKKLLTERLTHFRREYVMPQKLMRLLLKYFGIFYVSEKGKSFNVFLTEAYEGSELIDKCPLYVWKEKILRLTGYRGKRRTMQSYDDDENEEVDDSLFSNYSDNDCSLEIKRDKEDAEMDVEGIFDASKDY